MLPSASRRRSERRNWRAAGLIPWCSRSFRRRKAGVLQPRFLAFSPAALRSGRWGAASRRRGAWRVHAIVRARLITGLRVREPLRVLEESDSAQGEHLGGDQQALVADG